MAKRSLGHYDAAHNTIVVSRVFDRPSSPRYAIEYLLYHEMLHLKHPVKMRGLRRCVHSREFKAEEKLFPQLTLANGATLATRNTANFEDCGVQLVDPWQKA
jgi:predicted metal-dependent hydrolase